MKISDFYQTQVSWIFWWTFGTFSGFLLSLLLIEVGEKPHLGILEASIGGLAIAVPQSCILKKYIHPWRWMLSTLLGWILITVAGVGVVGWIVPMTKSLPLRLWWGIVSGGFGGLGIGLTQWWLAIPPSLPCGWQWIGFSSAIWAVAVPLGSSVGMLLHHRTQLFLSEVLGLALTWLIVAISSGINAYRLLK